MPDIQFDIFGGSTVIEPPVTTQAEARSIPDSVAVCPICGEGLWIESIDEVVQEDGAWLPSAIHLTCEAEPDIEIIDSSQWSEWHEWHFSEPYIDWLPVEDKVLNWMQQPEQRKRVELIWNSDGEEIPQGGDRRE